MRKPILIAVIGSTCVGSIAADLVYAKAEKEAGALIPVVPEELPMEGTIREYCIHVGAHILFIDDLPRVDMIDCLEAMMIERRNDFTLNQFYLRDTEEIVYHDFESPSNTPHCIEPVPCAHQTQHRGAYKRPPRIRPPTSAHYQTPHIEGFF